MEARKPIDPVGHRSVLGMRGLLEASRVPPALNAVFPLPLGGHCHAPAAWGKPSHESAELYGLKPPRGARLLRL